MKINENLNRNILLISYSKLEYDGRLRVLVELAMGLGNVICISRSEQIDYNKDKHKCKYYIFKYKGIFSYIVFCAYCIAIARKLESSDVIIADNRKAILPTWIIKTIKKAKISVYDARELYIFKEVKNINGKLGCIIELLFNKSFDIILAANEERANFMLQYYNLAQKPLVFPNIRKLAYDYMFCEEETREKYVNDFKEKWKLAITDGCSVARGFNNLIKIMPQLGEDFCLYVLGKSSNADLKWTRQVIEKEHITNIKIIGLVDHNELKWILEHCDIGIVSYSNKDLNNIYCASGKIYEFIFEGIPIVTTSNPPLASFCYQHGVGESGDDYFASIKKIISNYKWYKNNVLSFNVDINSYVVKIKKTINQKCIDIK